MHENVFIRMLCEKWCYFFVDIRTKKLQIMEFKIIYLFKIVALDDDQVTNEAEINPRNVDIHFL